MPCTKTLPGRTACPERGTPLCLSLRCGAPKAKGGCRGPVGWPGSDVQLRLAVRGAWVLLPELRVRHPGPVRQACPCSLVRKHSVPLTAGGAGKAAACSVEKLQGRPVREWTITQTLLLVQPGHSLHAASGSRAGAWHLAIRVCPRGTDALLSQLATRAGATVAGHLSTPLPSACKVRPLQIPLCQTLAEVLRFQPNCFSARPLGDQLRPHPALGGGHVPRLSVPLFHAFPGRTRRGQCRCSKRPGDKHGLRRWVLEQAELRQVESNVPGRRSGGGGTGRGSLAVDQTSASAA
ncbi:uncharacterized protein LOC123818784 [Phyllostomus hastatus]|uniref:uncharacterized protein LOC123818784 n=1 Tax=Phyllostomus hastatus TaxID=9423 RepID=UPI001E685565|nr:uncharacterized protein LOC123818784 [Phyllostomus hastatus]